MCSWGFASFHPRLYAATRFAGFRTPRKAGSERTLLERRRGMTCQETGLLIHAFADGELDLTKSLEMEAHLQECKSCALAQEEISRLRFSMKEPSLRFTPSASLDRKSTRLNSSHRCIS